MGKRITGGVIGAVLVFMWGFAFHDLSPLGDMGLSRVAAPQEAPFCEAVRASITESGLYFFPNTPDSKRRSDLQPDELEQWTKRYAEGPAGILILAPTGKLPGSPENLAIHFCCCLIGALMATFVLAHVVAGYGRRVLIATTLGLFSWLTISVPYWNWFAFPLEYTLLQAVEHGVGWLLGGLAIAGFSHHPRYNEE